MRYEKKCANTVIMGDFNAKIEGQRRRRRERMDWSFWNRDEERKRRKLIDFCTANRLFVTGIHSSPKTKIQDIGHGNHLEVITRIKLISAS
ncbi:hypothetical protein RRG08_057741 [Elysia crispata]|uniref:Endonuclease/exonuclease/phosphatase domain-containing protein n=1 Tax=Elysia crispata TaxID=231223 RepID=A0AAE1E3Q4_9GAST|nr:hypothetical protein RRG08_057741 [Elysia crispata]